MTYKQIEKEFDEQFPKQEGNDIYRHCREEIIKEAKGILTP